MTPRWAGAPVTQARAMWLPRILSGEIRCCRCGKPVIHHPEMRNGGWQTDHYPVSREHGGTETWPAHSKCNMSAGGKRGAQITNARKAAPLRYDQKIRAW